MYGLKLSHSFVAKDFTESLKIETSVAYKELKKDIERTLNRTFQGLLGFIKAVVKKFKKGSVVVDFDMIFDTKTAGKDTSEILKRVEETYTQATADGDLGNFTVTSELKILKVEAQSATGSSSSSKMATWVIVLIVCCIVLAFMAILLILQWVSAISSLPFNLKS